MAPRSPVGVSNLAPYNHIIFGAAFLAVLIPAPVHFKSGNPGVILFISWLLAAELIFFVNSFVWKGNVDNPAPFYCDLSTAILAVVAHGITSATICINRQLYRLSKAQAVVISKSQKRKELFIDLLIGIGIPLLGVGGHAIVQGHRYDIYEDVGCLPTTYNVTLAYPLYFIWPLVLAIISATFGLLALRQFLKRRKSFESLLSSTNSGMPKNRYIRLMWLCSLDLLLAIPYYIYNLIDNLVNRKVYPWVSWAETQADWYRIDRFRRIIIDMVPEIRIALYTLAFGCVFMSFVFFLVFGFTRETVKAYKNTYYWCMRPFGVKKPARVIGGGGGGLPQGYGGPRKKSWLDKLLRRDPVPLNSITNTTGSIPTFTGGQVSHQSKSIPSARPKATHSVTDTLNFDFDEEEKYIQTRSSKGASADYKPRRPRSDHSETSPFSSGADVVVVPTTPMSGASVIVIDGRRLTIPGLNAMASFTSSELEDEKEGHSPTTSITATVVHEEEKRANNPRYKGPSRI